MYQCFLDPWDCIGDDSSRLFSNFVRERTCRAGKCAGSEAWTRNWRSIGCRVASKRRNEGSQPGNFVFSGLAAAVRDGADAVAGRYDAGRMPGCVGACLVLGLEQAWLLAGFTGWGGFWGLPVFVATLFPQVVFYIPVFWLLLSWALAKERRIRTAGFLILLLVLGMGTALEVWLNPGFVSLLVSHCPF